MYFNGPLHVEGRFHKFLSFLRWLYVKRSYSISLDPGNTICQILKWAIIDSANEFPSRDWIATIFFFRNDAGTFIIIATLVRNEYVSVDKAQFLELKSLVALFSKMIRRPHRLILAIDLNMKFQTLICH